MLTLPLLPYQDPAVDKFLARGKLLMTMDMGTGKTVVSIAAAEELLGCGDINYCMVVCPASLKWQWAEALAKFTDVPTRVKKVKIDGKTEELVIPQEPYGIVIDGTPGKFDEESGEYIPGQRDAQYELIGETTDYIIMGYDNVLDDHLKVSKIRAQMVVCDEVTQIKTPGTKRSKRIKRMLNAPYRLGLTGTPVDNILEDLYSIMEWVDDEVLGRWDSFDASFIRRDDNGVVLGYRNLDVLRDLLAPAIFRKRRTDPDVASYMPEMVEDDWWVDLDDDSWDVYITMAHDLLDTLKNARVVGGFDIAAHYTGSRVSENSDLGRIMARQQAISLLLDHPLLVVESAYEYQDSQEQKAAGAKKKLWPGSKYCYEFLSSGKELTDMPSPKIDKLVEKCRHILDTEPDSKILVYTKYKRLLDIIQNAFDLPAVQYKGGMTSSAKAAAIRKFTVDPECRLFLSSHAGAYGCDMFMANHLVNVDQPPAVGKADQINGRHVRAASEFKIVYVHNMLVSGTIEERDPVRLKFKRRIGSAILDGEGATADWAIDDDRVSLTTWLEASLAGE